MAGYDPKAGRPARATLDTAPQVDAILDYAEPVQTESSHLEPATDDVTPTIVDGPLMPGTAAGSTIPPIPGPDQLTQRLIVASVAALGVIGVIVMVLRARRS